MATLKGDEDEKFRMIDDGEELPNENKRMNSFEIDTKPPVDKFRFVWFIFLSLGVAVLTPWNMFLTLAWTYFKSYKLGKEYTLNSTESSYSTLTDEQIDKYASNFPQLMSIVAQLPNLCIAIFNICFQMGEASLNMRICIALLTMVFGTIITIVMAMVDTSTNVVAFFVITLATVVLINLCCGVLNPSIFGLVSILPFKYVNAIILGNNLSGLILTIVSILCNMGTPDNQMMAIYYFMAAILACLIAFDGFFALPLTDFYRHYQQEKKRKDKHVGKQDKMTVMETFAAFKKILMTCTRHYLDIFMVFFVTLIVFPGIVMEIKPSEGTDITYESRSFFKEVYCLLVFNVFVIAGNFLVECIRFPGPKYLWILSWGRLLFLPLFLFCNTFDGRSLPIIFDHSAFYIIFMIFFSFTHGYGSSLAMMYAPNEVETKIPGYGGLGGQLSGVCLLSGICVGVFGTLAIKQLI